MLCCAVLSHSDISDSLQPMEGSPPGSSCPWGFSRQEYWSGLHALLQKIFPTQGSKTGLLHCQWILYCLSHQWSPRILEWVAYPFSSRSSQPRNWTGISCIAGRFFTDWATREAQKMCTMTSNYAWYFEFQTPPMK